jgi:hypothetical protein
MLPTLQGVGVLDIKISERLQEGAAHYRLKRAEGQNKDAIRFAVPTSPSSACAISECQWDDTQPGESYQSSAMVVSSSAIEVAASRRRVSVAQRRYPTLE